LANNWPHGEQPLSRGEKLVMGAVGVALIGALVSVVLLVVLRLLGPVSWPVGLSACALGLVVGALWVRPWEIEAPSRRG